MLGTAAKETYKYGLNTAKILPNVKELCINDKSTDSQADKAKREQYAQIALLLFHPFRIHSDLTSNNSYWKKYQELLAQGKFWKKGNEILQKSSRCHLQLFLCRYIFRSTNNSNSVKILP